MAQFAGLFARRSKFIGALFVDAVIDAVHRMDVTVTRFPVEVGVNINDHRIIEPLMLEMQGVISGIVSLGVPFLGGLPTLPGTPSHRGNDALNLMREIQLAKETVDVQTGMRTYRNMRLISVEGIEDKFTAGGVRFFAKLQEQITIQYQITDIPPEQYREGDTRNRAAASTKLGRVIPEDVNDVEANGAINYFNGLLVA